jgi:inhibitor of cysteine peptidase
MKTNNYVRIISICIGLAALMASSACASSTSTTASAPAVSTQGIASVSPSASSPASSASNPATTVQITTVEATMPTFVDESYSGKEYRMSAGSTLQVGLNSNPSTGFSWQLVQISDATVLEKVNNIYETPMVKRQEGSPPLVGAGGKEFWTFKGLKPGTAVISMEYSRPWEGGEKGVNKFSLTVIVK